MYDMIIEYLYETESEDDNYDEYYDNIKNKG